MIPITEALIQDFATAMYEKLLAKRSQKGDTWADDDWESEWRQALHEHFIKGDLVDIANYCAFGHYHGWSL